MYSELFYRLSLNYQENYTSLVIKKLLQTFESACDLFMNFNNKLRDRNIKRISAPKITEQIRRDVEHEIELMEKNGIGYCFYNDERYPKRLRACSDAPHQFFFKGSDDFNFEKSVAIVGTRSASAYGCDCVKHIIGGLAGSGAAIISGLALGIDTAVHEQAISNNLKTVAVMGTGFRRIYPQTNCHLAERIIESGGTLITEYPYDTMPDRQNFPRRNRIIAGLADATIVAETALKGGSMITAYIAHSYNRDVFAVPGDIFKGKHDGCHALIRKNIAALATSGEEIIEMMNWDSPTPPQKQMTLFVELSDEEQFIFDIIKNRKEVTIDDLMEAANQFSNSQVNALLLGLEFKNVIERKPGKKYICL